jgi:hypothetical protein
MCQFQKKKWVSENIPALKKVELGSAMIWFSVLENKQSSQEFKRKLVESLKAKLNGT